MSRPRRVAGLICLALCGWSTMGIAASFQVATWKNDAQAAFSLTHDDNRLQHITIMGPALTARGLVGTFAVCPGVSDWNSSWKGKYAALAAHGHELASHTMLHYSTIFNDPANPGHCFTSEEALRQDCTNAKAALDQINLKSTQSFVYPWGQDDNRSRQILRDYFLSARDADGYRPNSSGHFVPNAATPTNMYDLQILYVGGTWLYNFGDYNVCHQKLAAYIADTVASGGWGIEQYHDLNSILNADAYYEHLDDLQAESSSGELWIATTGDVTRYIYSRDAAHITTVSETASVIVINVDDGLPDNLFDVPLSIEATLPQEWRASQVSVSQGGHAVNCRWVGDRLVYDVLANGSAVVLSRYQSSPRPAGIPGDINHDGAVDQVDAMIIASHWGTTVDPWCDGDVSGDGRVNAADASILAANWGGHAEAVSSVPEAASLVYLVALLIATTLTRAASRKR